MTQKVTVITKPQTNPERVLRNTTLAKAEQRPLEGATRSIFQFVCSKYALQFHLSDMRSSITWEEVDASGPTRLAAAHPWI